MKKRKMFVGGIFLTFLCACIACVWIFYKDNGKEEIEISCTETTEEHIAQGMYGPYVNNELLITAKEEVSRNEIQKLAKKYKASIGGYIALAGISQWILEEDYTEEELNTLVEKVEKEDIVETVTLNRVYGMETENQDTSPAYMPSSAEWKKENWDDENPSGKNWYLEVIRADKAWEELSRVQDAENQAVKIGLIDTMFDAAAEKEQMKKELEKVGISYSEKDNQYKGNPDLDFAKTFFNPSQSAVKDYDKSGKYDSSHGGCVAAVMGATFDRGENSVGISGVYPYGAGNMYGVSKICFELTTYNQCYLIAMLLREGVKVINTSYITNVQGENRTFLTCMENSDEGRAHRENLQRDAEYLASFLKKCLNRGYEFVIVSAAGNNSWNYNKSITGDRIPYNYYLKEDGIWKEQEKNNNEYYQGTVDAKYVSVFHAIEDMEIRSRIIVAGSCYYLKKSNTYVVSDFSNGGTAVDILAPGEKIWVKHYDGDYLNEYGTSFAAPQVAGTAAMMWTANPSLTGTEIKNLIISSSQDRKVFFSGCSFAQYDKNNENVQEGIDMFNAANALYPILDAGEAVKCAKEYDSNPNGTTLRIAAITGDIGEAELLQKGKERYEAKKNSYTYPDDSLHINVAVYDQKEEKIYSGQGVKLHEVHLGEGTYTVRISSEGYEPVTVENLQIREKEDQNSEFFIGVTLKPTIRKHVEIIPHQMSWTQADEFCRSLDGQLATVKSDMENEAIRDLLLDSGLDYDYTGSGCWLGASLSDEGVWKWTDGSELIYENWCLGNPDAQDRNGQREQYMEMIFDDEELDYNVSAGEWNDTIGEDDTVQAFACEWEESDIALTREQEIFLKSVLYEAGKYEMVDFSTTGTAFLKKYLNNSRSLNYFIKENVPKTFENSFISYPKKLFDDLVKSLFGTDNGAENLAEQFRKDGLLDAEIRGDDLIFMISANDCPHNVEYVFRRFTQEEDYIRVEGCILEYENENLDAPLKDRTDFTMRIQIVEDDSYCEGIRLIDYKAKAEIPPEAMKLLDEDALNCTAEQRGNYSLDGFAGIQSFDLNNRKYLLGIYLNGKKDGGENHPYFAVIAEDTGEIIGQIKWGDDRNAFFDYRNSYISAADLSVVMRKQEERNCIEFIAGYSMGLLDGRAEYFIILEFDGESLKDSWNMTSSSVMGETAIYENGGRIYEGAMNDSRYNDIYAGRMDEHHINQEMLFSDQDDNDLKTICSMHAAGTNLYAMSGEVFKGTITDYKGLREKWDQYSGWIVR